MASEGAVGTAYFPCRSGGQLDFRWGLGRELLLAETSGRTQATECNFGGAQWDEPSSAQRQVAYDTMKLHKALHTQAMSEQDKAARLQSIIEYSQEVASVLLAACARPASTDHGQQAVKEDCCAWELLQLFYLFAPRYEGSVTQDLVMWMKKHNALLRGPEGSVWEAFAELCGGIEDEQAAAQTLPGYWQVIQRLVLVGWTDDARDLLYVHSETQSTEDRQSMQAENAASHLLGQTDALLRRLPQVQPLSGQQNATATFLPFPDYADARDRWKADCLRLLDSPHWWDDCQAMAPDTAQGLRITLSIMSGNRDEIDNIAASWLELLMGMLLYGLPAKAGTRHNVGLMITQCLSQKLSPASPSPSGHYLTLMEELLPGAAELDTPKVLAAGSQLSLWFKAHMPDILTAAPQGKSALQTTLEHDGGDLTEKLILAYAHSLMPYPTTWHVAAAYLPWCPCHGAEAMEQLLSQMPLTQADSRLANQVLHECQLYGLPQVAVGVCRQMGVHHWQAGRTAAAISWFIRGHDDSRASEAAAPLVRQIEDMLADTSAGFQPIPALQNLEGLLNSLAPGEAPANLAAPLQPQQQSKADSCVQHRGSLGFLQGFLKLQQALTCVAEAKDHRQVQSAAVSVRDMVMVLVGRKAAPQRMWLHLLFHVIPVIEASHPPVFSHKDTQLLLTRLQEAAVWITKDSHHQHQQHEVMTVRLALARGVAHAHLNAYQPTIAAEA